MATLYTNQSKNIWKTWTLMFGFLAVVILLGWGASIYFGNSLILYIVVAFAILTNIFSYWYSHKLVVKMAGAKPADRKQYFNLYTAVENMAITAGLPMPDVYVIDDPAPNAFATGRDPQHAVVAATTGLLNMLDKTELEGVIAHEISHIGNRDMLVSTVAVVLLGFVTILSDFFLHATLFGAGGGDRDERLQLIMLAAGLVLAILAPIIAKLMHMAISRKRELLADASGALLTRYPEGLASALEKIGSYNQPTKNARHATAHLYISNPFKGSRKGQWMHKLFMSHPPIEERVAALRQQKVEGE